MALLHLGILGGFSGKLGNVVGFYRKGQFFIRQAPARSSKPPTEKQLAQRARFAEVMRVLKPQCKLLGITMGKKHQSATGFNLGVQHALKHAFDAGGHLDYARLRFSQGRLARPYPLAVWRDSGMLRVEWSTHYCDELGQAGAMGILVYDPKGHQYYCAGRMLPRSLGYAFISLPGEALDRGLHIYLFAAAEAGPALFSDSVHTFLPAREGGVLCGA